MLEVFILLGFLAVTSALGIALGSMKALIMLLIIELFSLPGLWLIFKRSPPFVPTPKKTVRAMLSLSNVQKGDVIYDLGCGDGRIVLEAAKKGARATGLEFSLPTYLLAKFRTRKEKNATIRFKNFWKQSYGDADIVFCYLLTHTMKDFQEKIWPELKKGCRVVSHCFTMPDVAYAEAQDGVFMYVKD